MVGGSGEFTGFRFDWLVLQVSTVQDFVKADFKGDFLWREDYRIDLGLCGSFKIQGFAVNVHLARYQDHRFYWASEKNSRNLPRVAE